MTGDQCRAARALLDLTQPQLAELSRVKKQTIAAFENGQRPLRGTSLMRIRAALVSEGISFISDEDGVGVRRRRTLDELEGWEAERVAREESGRQGDPEIHMTPAQCRAARGLLHWTLAKLAKTAAVGTTSLGEFETGKRALQPRNLRAAQSALESAGVEFSEAGLGVRLKP